MTRAWGGLGAEWQEFNLLSQEETTWCQNQGLSALVRRAVQRCRRPSDLAPKIKHRSTVRSSPCIPGNLASLRRTMTLGPCWSQILDNRENQPLRDRQCIVTGVLNVTCSLCSPCVTFQGHLAGSDGDYHILG